MMSVAWKLIAALALMWMPVAMSPAFAAAMPRGAAAMVDHCNGRPGSAQGKADHSADCAGCIAVAALPARIRQPADAPALAAFAVHLDLRTGLHAETSTPPPKPA